MKAIILAAGKGTRMRPLTDHTPKPLIKTIRQQPLLAHLIEALPEEIDEVVLVVGYLREQIIEYFGDHFGRFKMSYVTQDRNEGTFEALELCKHLLASGERFLMLYGDDIHGPDGLKACAESQELALLASKVDDPTKFGILEIDSQGFVRGVQEKPSREEAKSDVASNGVMLLDTSVFDYPPKKHANGEYVLADAVGRMITAGIPFRAIHASEWIPVAYPEDLEDVNEKLERRKKPRKTPEYV